MLDADIRSVTPPGAPSVDELLQFERLLSELSASFIDLPAARIDAVIESGLRRIVETLDIDRSTLTRLAPDTGELHTTHSWAVEGLPPIPTTAWAKGAFPWAIATGRAGKPVVFSRLADLPPAAGVDKLAYQKIGLRSHVAQPLIVAGELIGFLSFGCIRRERVWPEDLLPRMRLLAEIFASAIARKRTQEELDHALGFERLLADLSASMLGARSLDVDRFIPEALQAIGEFLRVERVALWRVSPGEERFSLMHWWSAAGVPAPPIEFHEADVPWFSDRLLRGEVVHFTNLEELPADAGAEQRLQELGIRSLLLVPLWVERNIAGVLSFAALNNERSWPAAFVPRVKLIGEALANLLERDRKAKQLAEAQSEAAQYRERLAHLVRVHTVGEMSAALAHEISQPLVAIENYALAARRRAAGAEADPQRLAELLDKVIGQATRAGDVVKRLRGMVKRHDLELKAIDVERAVRECVEMVKTDCELHDIGLELKLAGGLPAVTADEIQIQQVILNLLRNAMEATALATPDAPKLITVTTAFSVEGGVSVRVADRGAGIAEGDLERVFEAFYSTKATGLGIGLAICRKIIEAHGGALRALHNPAGGAVFQFTLPVPESGD